RVDVTAEAASTFEGGVGDSDATANVDYQSHATVDAGTGAVITAHALDIATRQGITHYDRDAARHISAIGDLGDTSEGGALNAQRDITIDADINLVAGPNPLLVIDAGGHIVRAVNVTVNGGLGEGATVTGSVISVDPIANLPAGHATISAGGALSF